MEDQDKEFETFLAQFELRQYRAFPGESQMIPRRRRTPWVLAVAALVVAGVLSIPWLRNFSRETLPVAMVEVSGDSTYKAGEAVVFGTPIHSGGFESATLKLKDGTLIEMRAQSELRLESAEDGVRILLNNGSVLVTAATQRAGHLYVETQDSVVSVLGTMFFVEKTPLGPRVGVCEGEMAFQHDTVLRKVLPGQQASTNPVLEGSLVEAIAWSSSAPRLSALLQAPVGGPALGHTPSETQEQQPPPPPPLPPPPVPPKGQPKPDVPPQQAQPPQPPDSGADDHGRSILNRACGSCHVVGFVETTRYNSREAYASLVARQRAYGAGVSEGEAPVLVDYLFRPYGIRGK